MKKVLYTTILAGMLLAAGCGWWGGSSSSRTSTYEPEPANPSRATAPRSVQAADGVNLFRLPMPDGQPVTVKTPAILFFYTSWCGYCKQAMPEFKQITNRARNQGWRVYGIQVGESATQANAFINQYQPNFPVLVDQQSRVARTYQIKGYPTFVVVDADGNITYDRHELPRMF
ncbi:MAG: TlpA family protein disulfide reductase [Planctomycetes bacterium]|nr:TlpA family protein disulfide reductase [Planctomycetota bacterium]